MENNILHLKILLKSVFSKYNSNIILYRLKHAAKISKVKINLGNDVLFYQSTIITGKGLVSIGNSSVFGYKMGGYHSKGRIELQPRYKASKIIIGKNVMINNNLFICCADEVSIGNGTLIGESVMILDHNGHGISPNERRTTIGKVAPIHIEDNVWVGSRVTILPGTRIGRNSIISAGSIIKGDFPSNVIISGNPAMIVSKIKENETK